MTRWMRTVLGLSLLALASCGGDGKGGGSGVHHTTGNLTPGWFTLDVGAVGAAGATNYTGTEYQVTASGADIWDSADAFRFVYRTLNGDGEMIARVVSLEKTDDWAKAGVMIRESLVPNAKFAMSVVTPVNGTSFQYRPVTGQGCALSWGPAAAAPYWVRIVRAGNTITGYASADGSAWTQMSSQTIAMAASVYIGLCVTSHNNSARANAVFDSVWWTGAPSNGGGGGSFDLSKLGPDMYHVTVLAVDGDMHATFGSAFIQVTNPVAGNSAPSIGSVTANPSTVSPRGTVQLSASATDADGDPLRFAWIIPAGENTCSFGSTETWTAPTQPGTYTLRVLVSDGKVWSQSSVNVTVNGSNPTTGVGNHPPYLKSISASAASVAPGQTVQLTLDAADVDGPALTYAWFAPGGGSISGSGTTVTWTAPGVGSGRPAKAGLWIWPRTLPAGCPVPLSTDLPGIAFVGRAATQHFADTFMPTWASDGSMYSPWQDGVLLTPPFENMGGWHAGDATALNGWVKIVGDDPQDLLIPMAGELAGPKGNWSGRYPAAIFAKDGVVYYGVRSTAVYDTAGNLTNDQNLGYRYANGTFIGFYTSTNGGSSWSASPNADAPLFPEPHGGNLRVKFGQPYMVDHGKNQQHSPDGKVYFVSSGATDTSAGTDHINDDQVYLCRVTASAAGINNLANWEFYSNGGWTSTLSAATPIFEWRNRVNGATMTWNPGLGKYLMFLYKNGYSHVGTKIEWGEFDTYVLESSSMTGPWKLVHYWPSFGKQGYYPNLPSKFLSGDGKDAWMWYGSNFSPWDREIDPPGGGYHMSQQRIRFLTAADTP